MSEAETNSEKRILIVEDSDIFAEILMEFLALSHYTLERAVNGFEGIKKVYSFKPHLIITDVEMPLFKGHQVTRFLKMRKTTKTIPIIMFTTLTEKKEKFWGVHAGADKYFEKTSENFQPLNEAVKEMLAACGDINFAAIEREGKKINDDSIIEMVNNLLDNKLFQTTVAGMLAELSSNVSSMELIAKGIIDLLQITCEVEITAIMIRSGKGTLYVYTANSAGFTTEIADDFYEICASDFNSLFPDFHVETKDRKDFLPQGIFKKKIVSYTMIPLTIGGENFASVHIGNTINEYFSTSIVENTKIFLGTAAPIIANSLSMHELVELQKNTRTAFARYVPPHVMDEIIVNSSSPMANQSENRNITILFSDIRDFTKISENSNAQDVVDFLNTYFAALGDVIISEGGHIDKFIGDAIMAVFGASRNDENPMSCAVRAAIKMLAAVEHIDYSKISLPHGGVEIGIGIHSGECILGNIGFQNKMDYTVIGDTVNVASRIEGITKIYRHPIIVSEHIYDDLKNKFLLRKVDDIRVKGKEKPIGVYAVYSGFKGTAKNVPRSDEIPDIPMLPSLLVDKEMLGNYEKGLWMFHLREWKTAQGYFSDAVKTDKSDYLSQLYLERTSAFMDTPPPADWDGVFTLTEK